MSCVRPVALLIGGYNVEEVGEEYILCVFTGRWGKTGTNFVTRCSMHLYCMRYNVDMVDKMASSLQKLAYQKFMHRTFCQMWRFTALTEDAAG